MKVFAEVVMIIFPMEHNTVDNIVVIQFWLGTQQKCIFISLLTTYILTKLINAEIREQDVWCARCQRTEMTI